MCPQNQEAVLVTFLPQNAIPAGLTLLHSVALNTNTGLFALLEDLQHLFCKAVGAIKLPFFIILEIDLPGAKFGVWKWSASICSNRWSCQLLVLALCHSSFVKVSQILKCSFCKFFWIFVLHCEEAGYWVVILKFCGGVCGQQWAHVTAQFHGVSALLAAFPGCLPWLLWCVSMSCYVIPIQKPGWHWKSLPVSPDQFWKAFYTTFTNKDKIMTEMRVWSVTSCCVRGLLSPMASALQQLGHPVLCVEEVPFWLFFKNIT